jgi:hypothetical protein
MRKVSRVRFAVGVPVAGFVVTAVDRTSQVSMEADALGVHVQWQGTNVLVPWSNVSWALIDAEPAPPPPRARSAK